MKEGGGWKSSLMKAASIRTDHVPRLPFTSNVLEWKEQLARSERPDVSSACRIPKLFHSSWS